MDVIIILLVIALAVFFFKKSFSGIIYMIVIVDIFLRIVNFIKLNLVNGEIASVLSRYFPSSIPAIINHYSSGILNTILMWLLVIIYMIFEYYIIGTFIRKH